MIILDILSIAIAAFTLHQLQDLRKQHNARLNTLERRESDKRVVEKFGKTEQVPDYLKPIDNFTPKKPETLRPNQVRGREVEEREFEFDVKI